MFKAKLIENKNYYKLKGKMFLLMVLLLFPVGLWVNFYQIPIWLTVLLIGVSFTLIILMSKYQKQMRLFLGNKILEIDIDEIRIISIKGTEKEIINLNDIERIVLKEDYSMYQDNIKDISQDLRGNNQQNFVILFQDGHQRRLDFEIDSYYMLHQFNQLIETWKTKDYKIERNNKDDFISYDPKL